METGWSHLLCILGKIEVLHGDVAAILGTVTIVAPKSVQGFLQTPYTQRSQRSEVRASGPGLFLNSPSSLRSRRFVSRTRPASPVCLAISKHAPSGPQRPSRCYFQGRWLQSSPRNRKHVLSPSQHPHPRSLLRSLLCQPLAPNSATEDFPLPQTHPT